MGSGYYYQVLCTYQTWRFLFSCGSCYYSVRYVVNNSHFLVNALGVRMYFTRYQVRVFVFCFHNFCFRNAEGACSQKPHLI